VGGVVEQVCQLGAAGEMRQAAVEGLARQAVEQAEAAGSLPGTCRLAAVDVLPLAYMTGGGRGGTLGRCRLTCRSHAACGLGRGARLASSVTSAWPRQPAA
jgi:hypothetical protein